jgi:hypothetical protein
LDNIYKHEASKQTHSFTKCFLFISINHTLALQLVWAGRQLTLYALVNVHLVLIINSISVKWNAAHSANKETVDGTLYWPLKFCSRYDRNTRLQDCNLQNDPEQSAVWKAKPVPLHATKALGGRGCTPPTHSRPQH